MFKDGWIPSCAGMTELEIQPLLGLVDICVGSIEKVAARLVIHAQAGIQKNLIVVWFLAVALHRFAKKYLLVKANPRVR